MQKNSGKGPRRKIERWETLEVLYSGREPTQRVDIGLVIEVKRPIFEGGVEGFPKLGATLSRGERFLRFECFDGDTSEIEALATLVNGAVGLDLKAMQATYDTYVDEHKAKQRPRGGTGRQEKPGGVGGGLSRGNKGEGKTARKRRRRREAAAEQSPS